MAEVIPLARSQSAWAGWVTLSVVLLLALLALYLLVTPRLVRFDVSSTGLTITGDWLYGRSIPLADIRAKEARSVDLTADRDYQTTARLNGVGLPNYKAGWFRLRNGEKALVFVSDPRHVVYIPGQTGYSVLLSVNSPANFVEKLKAAGSGS
jgi:hypothetical protein